MSQKIMRKPTMQFQMRSWLEKGNKYHPHTEIVSRDHHGMFKYTNADFYDRVCRLCNVLADLGIERGDKIATLAWNTHRHFELFYALPCMGSIIHTVNIVLFREQLIHIINQAEDKLIFIDVDLVPLVEGFMDELKTVKGYVIMTDLDKLPETKLSPVYSYEELLSKVSPTYEFPQDIDENEACFMVYSSGTTGMPRGYFYSARQLCLTCMDAQVGIIPRGLTIDDVYLQIVPMFHAAGWQFPYLAYVLGTKQVYPGPRYDVDLLCELIAKERVTFTGGVPTIARGIFDVARRKGYDISSLSQYRIAGSPPSPALIQEGMERGVAFIQGYGFTESGWGNANLNMYRKYMEDWPKEMIYAEVAKQGTPSVLNETKVLNVKGEQVKWGSDDMGEVWVRSPGMTVGIYKDEDRTAELFDDDGWMNTQDIAKVDENGALILVDRSKDVIKSGGEWISSVDLENMIMAYPKVLEAVVFAVPHPKWDERPAALVVPREEYKDKLTGEEIVKFLEGNVTKGKLAKFWIPDEIKIVGDIPKTGTGKFDKKRIRTQYRSLLSQR